MKCLTLVRFLLFLGLPTLQGQPSSGPIEFNKILVNHVDCTPQAAKNCLRAGNEQLRPIRYLMY